MTKQYKKTILSEAQIAKLPTIEQIDEIWDLMDTRKWQGCEQPAFVQRAIEILNAIDFVKEEADFNFPAGELLNYYLQARAKVRPLSKTGADQMIGWLMSFEECLGMPPFLEVVK